MGQTEHMTFLKPKDIITKQIINKNPRIKLDGL